MSGEFDPYYTWLAIPPEEQPPDHYRLLGLRPFEENPEVIQNAADRQMAHLRNFQAGVHAESSQRLLNEISRARVCLLNPHRKTSYDQHLRRVMQARLAGVAPPPPPSGVYPAGSYGSGTYTPQSFGSGSYPQPFGSGAYPQPFGSGAYPQPQSFGSGAYPQPQSFGSAAYPQPQPFPGQPGPGYAPAQAPSAYAPAQMPPGYGPGQAAQGYAPPQTPPGYATAPNAPTGYPSGQYPAGQYGQPAVGYPSAPAGMGGPTGVTPTMGGPGGSTLPNAGFNFPGAAAYPAAHTQLGEYELIEKLGEGGMGAVYRARHVRLGREVALKALSPTHLKDHRALVRFDREMRAVGAVDHPNVVRAMDAREIGGTRFLVMEFVDGMELSDVVRHVGPLAVPDAAELIRQAACGLLAAHEHGLVHRDIKPSNLMVTRQGWVKLCDLGLAPFAMDLGEEEVTGTGQAMGTPDFMAPEQIANSRRVDIRADIYSLGCTFYKLVTGWAPFTGPEYRTAVQKMMAHTDKAPPAVDLIRKDIHPDLVAVINRMMAKDPSKRFATPAELVAALQPFTVGANLSALFQRAEAMAKSPQAPGSQPSFPAPPQPSAVAAAQKRGLFGAAKSLLAHYKTPLLVFLGALIGVLLANLLALMLLQPPRNQLAPPLPAQGQQAAPAPQAPAANPVENGPEP